MFSGLAAAIGVGSGSLATTGGVLGGVLGTEDLRAGGKGHGIEYVAVGDGADATDAADNIQYSNDLENFKLSTTVGKKFSTFAGGKAVAYGKDIWVAGGAGTQAEKCVLWSTDRRYWHDTIGTNFINSAANGCKTVVYGSTGGDDRNGLWLAGGTCFNANDTIYWSDDGKNWLDVGGFGIGVGFGETCDVIAWGGPAGSRRFIAGGASAQGYTTKLMYSDNGLTPPGQSGGWTNCNVPTEFYNAEAIAYGNRVWLAGGSGESGPEYTLISSIDNGEHWTQGITVPFSGDCLSIAYGNGVWVVSGAAAPGGTDPKEDRLSYLTNAGDFTVNNTFQPAESIQDPPGTTTYGLFFFNVIYTGKEFVASGQLTIAGGFGTSFTGIIYVSSDGKNWKFKDRNFDCKQINQIAYKP